MKNEDERSLLITKENERAEALSLMERPEKRCFGEGVNERNW